MSPRDKRKITVTLDAEIADRLDALAFLEGVKPWRYVKNLLTGRITALAAETPEVEQLVMLGNDRPVARRVGGLRVFDGGAS